MIGIRSTVHRNCIRAWLHQCDMRPSLCCQHSTKVVTSTTTPKTDGHTSTKPSTGRPFQPIVTATSVQNTVNCIQSQEASLSAGSSSLSCSETSDSSFTQQHQSGSDYDPQLVTVCYKPTQRLYNLDLRSEKEMSVYVRQREELLTLKVSERFKKLVEEIHLKEREGSTESRALESIDDLSPPKEIKLDYKSLPTYYLRLSKIRLSGLVVCTAVAGYLMAPGPFSFLTFTLCTAGTALLSASANSVNQYLEKDFDSQMKRTKDRPLVMDQISTSHAMAFAALTGLSGTMMLAVGVNPLTASLGFVNLLLYTAAYTPMKRLSIANTWVGSVVGAIPPMMGWAASCDQLTAGAWLLGAIMYAWQFPHFCALSWNLRGDYSRAGYRMMAVSHPELCRRVSLRYSVAMLGLCSAAPYLGVTTWWFAVDSLPVNTYLIYLAWKFYRDGDSGSSRRLFHYTLLHLPAIMVLMLISKDHHRHDNQMNSEHNTKSTLTSGNSEPEPFKT